VTFEDSRETERFNILWSRGVGEREVRREERGEGEDFSSLFFPVLP